MGQCLCYLDHSYMLDLTTPTESTVEKLIEGQEKSTVLDLSKKGLKKVPKPEDAQHVKELILDENALQKIDNIDCFLMIEKVRKVMVKLVVNFVLICSFDLHF